MRGEKGSALTVDVGSSIGSASFLDGSDLNARRDQRISVRHVGRAYVVGIVVLTAEDMGSELRSGRG